MYRSELVGTSLLVLVAPLAFSGDAKEPNWIAGVEVSPDVTLTLKNNTKIGVRDPPIVATKAVSIAVTYDAMSTTPCRNTNLAFEWAHLTVIDSAGNQTEDGSITALDIWGGIDCTGHHNKVTSFPPISAKGTYILSFLATTNAQHQDGSDFVVYPNIKIQADGVTVVDRSFPSPGGVQHVQQVFTIELK
jgi:hypothetical protein